MRLQRYKRKAAARVMLCAFHSLSYTANSTLVFKQLEWGEDLFTPKEKAYVEKLRLRVHEDGELCRKLAHRLSR